ncbi:MAG: UMP kinase [Bacteroidota bacterium]
MKNFKRILLKLSGESLAGTLPYGIDPEKLKEYAAQIAAISRLGVETGIVVGGGNIFRGLSGVDKGFDRVKGDSMGILATVINSIAIQAALENEDVPARVFTAIRMEPAAGYYSKQKAVESLKRKEVVIIAGGTGNPYFTTDTAAALRAAEIEADALFKGTRVDGVYDDDPEKNPKAKKFQEITFSEAYKRNLKIMDLTAFTLCKENNIPVIVFDMDKPGNLEKIISGKNIGTIVRN